VLLQKVRQFGGLISSRMSHYEDTRTALPDIALEELSRSDIINLLTYKSIAQAVACEESLPRQYGGANALGDPPVTLFLDPGKRFYIEALLHSAASTAIHDHSFSGAFAVVSGRCAHQVFCYETDDPAGDLTSGALTERQSEQLDAGDFRPIHNGTRFIHRNVHLDRPTLTVVIRTVWDGCRQHTYHQPGLALDSNPSPKERKQLQMLSGLLKVDAEAASAFLRQLLAAQPTGGQAFRCLDFYVRTSRRWDDLESLLELGGPAFGNQIATVGNALSQGAETDPSLMRLLGRDYRFQKTSHAGPDESVAPE
jgi:hypothetical protein